jgi:hypothetical protein
MNVRAIAARVYGDYVQRERLDELHALLAAARANGYATMTLSAFADRVAAGSHESGERILLLRHDIDSDPPRARRMSEIERSLGMIGSFFFRRSTWDVGLMRELVAAGCDVGYHYEELATLIKQQGAATAVAARALLDPARARLRSTLASLRADTGLRLDVLAAHGDFANRAVGVSSREISTTPRRGWSSPCGSRPTTWSRTSPSECRTASIPQGGRPSTPGRRSTAAIRSSRSCCTREPGVARRSSMPATTCSGCARASPTACAGADRPLRDRLDELGVPALLALAAHPAPGVGVRPAQEVLAAAPLVLPHAGGLGDAQQPRERSRRTSSV